MDETYAVLLPNHEMAAVEGDGYAGAFWTSKGWQVAAHTASNEVLVLPPADGSDVDASRVVLAAASARLWLNTGGGWIAARHR